VRAVVNELRGEKVDVVLWSDDPATLIAEALQPSRVRSVLIDDESKTATVVVPDRELSLAIGKEGQNARLAARLTGWRIDIKSESQRAAGEARRQAPVFEPPRPEKSEQPAEPAGERPEPAQPTAASSEVRGARASAAARAATAQTCCASCGRPTGWPGTRPARPRGAEPTYARQWSASPGRCAPDDSRALFVRRSMSLQRIAW
jgi:hypothetical protein